MLTMIMLTCLCKHSRGTVHHVHDLCLVYSHANVCLSYFMAVHTTYECAYAKVLLLPLGDQ